MYTLSLGLKSIKSQLLQVLQETEESATRQQEHNQETKGNEQWLHTVMVAEVLFFVAMIGYQLNHMKNQLESKLIL